MPNVIFILLVTPRVAGVWASVLKKQVDSLYSACDKVGMVIEAFSLRISMKVVMGDQLRF
jgi:hypothetical protein